MKISLTRIPESIAKVNINIYIISLSLLKCIVYNAVITIHSSFSVMVHKNELVVTGKG